MFVYVVLLKVILRFFKFILYWSANYVHSDSNPDPNSDPNEANHFCHGSVRIRDIDYFNIFNF